MIAPGHYLAVKSNGHLFGDFLGNLDEDGDILSILLAIGAMVIDNNNTTAELQ